MSVARRTFVFPISFTLKSKNGISSLSSGTFFFFAFASLHVCWVIAWPCLLNPASLGRPTRELRGINGGHSCSLPHGCPLSTVGCLMKVVPGSSGGSKKSPIVPCPNLSQAAVERLLWHTKKAIGFHDLVEKKMLPNEVDCGNDWCWICYLCIMTYAECYLTLGRSLQGRLSVTE